MNWGNVLRNLEQLMDSFIFYHIFVLVQSEKVEYYLE